MNLMKSTYRINWVAVFLLLVLVACTENDVPMSEKENMRICWNVRTEGMLDGRALVENNMDLETACTSGIGDKAIGIWSVYRLNGDSAKNVLGVNEDVSLVYSNDEAWNNWTGWTYGEKVAFWKDKAVYYFNAYFPKVGGLTFIANDSTSLKGTYDTETTQTDLMVSRVKVDTNNNFQGSPVELPMVHALATLKFVFLMDGGEATKVLKAFSLDKTLKTSAKLNYNTNTMNITNWTNRASSAKNRIYEWVNRNGIPFTTTTSAVAYTTGNDIYQTNDGFILIIPQDCMIAPTFSCTIGEEGLDDVSFENVSLGNTLFEPGKNYIYTIKVKDKVISELNYRVEDWGNGGGSIAFN